MNREECARKNHRFGSNCSSSVFKAFDDIVEGAVPAPRSDGGKCGAFLAGRKVLEDEGKDVALFEERFTQKFGAITCADLRRLGVPCNDLVGGAASLVEEQL